MTGFGSAEKSGCRVEIRSLNQRFLEIYIKSPSFLSQHEMAFRNVLRSRFNRGKFDVTISITGEAAADLKVNNVVAGRIFNALRALQEEFRMPGALDINSMAYFHDKFMETDVSYDIEEVQRVFDEAVDSLQNMRSREGQLLAEELIRLVDSLEAMNRQIKDLIVKAMPEAVVRLQEKLSTLLGNTEIDPARMNQEIAILASKVDIAEETARLESHIQQFRELLGSDIAGRKLDFLVQELNREVNTMSSKSADYGISRLAVDM
ncbi:MAG: YicC/YloC family endoribonuclease, partial [Nitrospirota bacterium]|nr:YicC/YloC family endoribonuclease [Nitrospirota bacterium]